MLEIPEEIGAHLARQGTVVVPSRQRAAALRLAHSAGMLAQGQRVWPTPDILPWGAWLERGLAEARARGEPVPRRLLALEDWLAWREAVLEAAGHAVLAPEGLVEPVRRAAALLDDYGIRLEASAGAEAQLLVRARELYRTRCRERGVLGTGSWRDCAPFLRPSSRVLFAGFGAAGSARRAWLTGHEVRWHAPLVPESALATLRVASLADERQQAEAAADWCASMLRRDPRARLLVVVPRLQEQRPLWEQALRDRLDYAPLLSGQAGTDASFVVEGGQPLRHYPLVDTALNLLTLAAGQAHFGQLSALLRSGYLAEAERGARLRLDSWLRAQGIDVASLPVLERLRERLQPGAGEEAARLVQRWSEALALQEGAAGAWAQRFAGWLSAFGWPGVSLTSDEQQVRMRFDELLGELAAAEAGGPRRSLTQVLGLLRELTARIAFEPASDDVPVTLSPALDDPIVRYDGIWLAGLTADTWPPPARPDPFIPLPLQRAAGIPVATAAGQLQRARQLQQSWRAAAGQCIASWASSDDELQADPSPLLPVAEGAWQRAGGEPGVSAEAWVAAAAVPLQPWRDGPAPRWGRAGSLPGGTRLLELQARCPFRSVAQLRLGAEPMPEPQPGIDARRRGRILHRAIELLWKQLHDQRGLQALDGAARAELIDRCSAAAVQALAAELPGELHAVLLERERERTRGLLAQLIGWELARPAFQVEALERSELLHLAGTSLRMRLDRIDRLEDGRLLVIDYKTGQPQRLDPHEPRPTMPQLPAYATALGPAVAAVVALYVGRGGVRAQGLADREDRIPRLPVLREGDEAWGPLLGQWRERLQLLLDEFVRGHAAVAPQPGACDWCHLHLFCRIDPSRLTAGQSAPAGEAADGGERQGGEVSNAAD